MNYSLRNIRRCLNKPFSHPKLGTNFRCVAHPRLPCHHGFHLSEVSTFWEARGSSRTTEQKKASGSQAKQKGPQNKHAGQSLRRFQTYHRIDNGPSATNAPSQMHRTRLQHVGCIKPECYQGKKEKPRIPKLEWSASRSCVCSSLTDRRKVRTPVFDGFGYKGSGVGEGRIVALVEGRIDRFRRVQMNVWSSVVLHRLTGSESRDRIGASVRS